MSSFKRRVPSAQASLPTGCRLSAYNGQVLISTGVPSLDDILGGGLPVGTILLIQEDRQTSYGQLLLKYFLRQGVVAGDKCVVVSGDEPPEAIMRSLMGIAGEESLNVPLQKGVDNRDGGDDGDNDAVQDKLTIAWRYSGLKKFESGVEARNTPSKSISPRVNKSAALTPDSPPSAAQIPFCEQFDLTTRISARALESADTTLIDSGDILRSFDGSHLRSLNSESEEEDNEEEDDMEGHNQPDLYRSVLEKIRDVVIGGGFSTALARKDAADTAAANKLQERHICRIGINSIASPSWRGRTPHDLYKFLHALRGLLRFSFGAAVVTIPAHLYGTIDQRHVTDGSTSSPFIHRLEQLCDASVRIESFAGALTNSSSAASDYHGLFHVHKIPVLNSLVPSSTKLSILLDGSVKGTGGASGARAGSGAPGRSMNNLGFKVRRKRFAIETFHLPPEGGVGQRRTSAEPSSSPSASLAQRKSGSSTGSSSSSTSGSQAGTGAASTATSTTSTSSTASKQSGVRAGSSFAKRSNIAETGSLKSRAASASTPGKVDIHSVPGASGVARKMMGLPPVGIQGAVSTGCSSTGPHTHTHQKTPGTGGSGTPHGSGSNSLLDF